MIDLEITKACAAAMGIELCKGVEADPNWSGEYIEWLQDDVTSEDYWPLKNDAQAMALVKKLKLSIAREHHGDRWMVGKPHPESISEDLNRAICECCAKMMLARKGASDDAKSQGKDR